MNYAIEVIALLITTGWRMLISITFPGTNMPIAVIMIGAFVVVYGIKLFALILNKSVNVGAVSASQGALENRERIRRK